MCTSSSSLDLLVKAVYKCLAVIGLEVEVSKSKLVVIGAPKLHQVTVDDTVVKVEDRLQFLGMGISRSGALEPWLGDN